MTRKNVKKKRGKRIRDSLDQISEYDGCDVDSIREKIKNNAEAFRLLQSFRIRNLNNKPLKIRNSA